MKLEKLTDTQKAIADLVSTRMADTGHTAQEVAQELCAPGGPLRGQFLLADVLRWHRQVAVREQGERRWGREVATDPESMADLSGEKPKMDPGTMAGAIAGKLMDFMDAKLKTRTIRWGRTATSLAAGDSWRQVEGPGRMMIRGVEKVWGAGAVIKERAGRAVAVFPECFATGYSHTGRRRTLNMNRPVMTGEHFSAEGMAQMVAALLLLFREDAGGLTSHTQVADALGRTRANGSFLARKMAKKIVATGGIVGAAVIRKRETLSS